jgi:hypothetical protein
VSAGFSKWAGAGGWRLGYQLYPRALMHLYVPVKCVQCFMFPNVPTPQQYAAIEVTLLLYTNNTDKTTVSVLLHKCTHFLAYKITPLVILIRLFSLLYHTGDCEQYAPVFKLVRNM